MTTTVAALFANEDAARAAIKDLHDIGIGSSSISMVKSDRGGEAIVGAAPLDAPAEIAGAGAVTGTVLGGSLGLLIGLGALAIPGIGPVLAGGSILATLGATAAGAGIGAATGSIVGGLMSTGISEDDAHVYAEGVRRGDTLVLVNVVDGAVKPVETALGWHKPINIEERAATLREGGWTKFDTEAAPFEGDAVATFREMERDDGTTEGASRTTDADTAVHGTDVDLAGRVRTYGRTVDSDVEPARAVTIADNEFDDPFQAHYQRTFAARGKPYENYGPVYRYGERLGRDERFRAMDWNAIEGTVRHEWEHNNPNTWNEVKDAVQYAWERTRAAQ